MQAFAHNYYLFMNRVNRSSGQKVRGEFFFLNSTVVLGYKSGCACFVGMRLEFVAENDH